MVVGLDTLSFSAGLNLNVIYVVKVTMDIAAKERKKVPLAIYSLNTTMHLIILAQNISDKN